MYKGGGGGGRKSLTCLHLIYTSISWPFSKQDSWEVIRNIPFKLTGFPGTLISVYLIKDMNNGKPTKPT